MARDAIEQFLALADTVRVAADLARREASLGQACGEAEARLAGLRADEAALERRRARERVALNEQVDGTKVQAEAILKAAEAKAAEALRRCASECFDRERTAEARLRDIEDRIAARGQALSRYEEEEARLGQSVAALKADLTALRAKLS